MDPVCALDGWLAESDENRRQFAQAELILKVTNTIWKAMKQQGISNKELADRLGKNRSFVTQILDGERNMTLRTLSDVARALELEPVFMMKQKLAHENRKNAPIISMRPLTNWNSQSGQDIERLDAA